jgi:hypothetical protein
LVSTGPPYAESMVSVKDAQRKTAHPRLRTVASREQQRSARATLDAC